MAQQDGAGRGEDVAHRGGLFGRALARQLLPKSALRGVVILTDQDHVHHIQVVLVMVAQVFQNSARQPPGPHVRLAPGL